MVIQPTLWVNMLGERFCDESVGDYDTSSGNANVKQKDGCTFSIYDSTYVRHLMEKGIDRTLVMDLPPSTVIPELDRKIEAVITSGSTIVFGADSIKELAEKLGINPEIMQATVDEYNRLCSKGYDDIFGKDTRFLRPITGPRFYASKAKTAFLGTLGGIKINQKTEVIDKKYHVIPGLYAGGYDAGGMYGDSYTLSIATGLSSAFALNSGRIAGKNALKFINR